jgi:hypothetical protein
MNTGWLVILSFNHEKEPAAIQLLGGDNDWMGLPCGSLNIQKPLQR